MYNRYIPQPDGSYRRNAMPDPRQNPSRHPQQPHSAAPPPQHPDPLPPKAEPIPGFLRQLIPQGFDTGDLIVVLLLLLMAGDKPEDKNTALLTLALYCFL